MERQSSDDILPISVDTAAADFEGWVRLATPAMYRTVRNRYPQLDAAELVQESLLRAWQRRATYRPERGEPTPWLLAILMDQCRQRRRRRHPVVIPMVGDSEQASPHDDPDIDLAAAIARLPAKQRGAIECHYLIGLSIAESAIVLGCRKGTVKSNLSDARRNLRHELEDRR